MESRNTHSGVQLLTGPRRHDCVDSPTVSDLPRAMSNTDAAIREAVESFVEELRGLIQAAALESVQSALSGGTSLGRSPKPGRRAPFTAFSKARQQGNKRTPEELEALVKKLHSYLTKNPGQRIEQVGTGLGVSTKELALPVKKLVSEKKITSKGQRRATTYFAK
jgi:hypothetical protein